MSKIHLLDDTTINKIAAGEVVERPASVVKELVENSIDAGATRIEVEIMAGGTSFLRVTDNGHGMGREDAEMAILRHATSKIQAVRDLETIGTLGFRGEALPTIASVSRFTLQTRREGEELGTQVKIFGGKEKDVTEMGCNLGTTIQVEDLFFNTPARKKFLKTNRTEEGKISDFLTKLALSHPEITFRLINNNRLAMTTPGSARLYDTVTSIYGNQIGEALLGLVLDDDEREVKIRGFITKPSMLRSSRAWQTLIVNGRVVQSPSIMKAIDNAYRSMIPKTGYPLAVVLIDVPQRTLDVNVHPQKTEMKFEDESLIFKAVYKAVLDAVRPAETGLRSLAASVEKPMRHVEVMEPMHFVPATEVEAEDPLIAAWGGHNTPAGEVKIEPLFESRNLSPEPLPQTIHAALHQSRSTYGEERLYRSEPQLSIVAESTEEFSGGRLAYTGRVIPIGQVDLTYIIAQDERGLYIVDQHAAHERILFDRFSRMAEDIPAQQLLVHELLTFDAKEAALIEEHQAVFERLGFGLTPCGNSDFRLTEIPADLAVGEAEDAVRDILADLGEMHKPTAKEIRAACIATTACRAAIKAGEELNFRQMQILLEELARADYPYTCPHGRPTILKFSSEELAKMFKRTGF